MTRTLKLWIPILMIGITGLLQGQDALPLNWHLLDKSQDGLNGVSAEKTYAELLKGKKSKTIVVAILDSGVDAEHEDLKSVMWVNPKEIPNNMKDDDNNGYVDDIHGWNFIGGKNGNVGPDTYESTRLYGQMRYKYETADREKLTAKQKKEYDLFIKLKSEVEKRRKSAQNNLKNIEQSSAMIFAALDTLAITLGDKAFTQENLNAIDAGSSKSLGTGVAIAKQVLMNEAPVKSIAELKSLIEKDFEEGLTHFSNELKYAFNPDFNSREIVGDDYANIYEKSYGNNDVEGPDASHGTHVAGIVAANRNNQLGMAGVADRVRIMSVRCVPDGDERDKDVANAIRYAVDNGASIINMSFGKGYSPNKELVDEAVRYAESHDVLLVHAAGNSASDNDKVANFPNKQYQKKKFFGRNKASNWLEVGALSFEDAPDLIAGFSNYGKKSVDLFSPGVQIYSTVPGSEYEHMQGTSMASPVAAGVAAMLRSYFPELTARQVIDIMVKSAVRQNLVVEQPGSKKDVKLSEVSRSGGIVNAYEAVKLASKTKGKKKLKERDRYDADDLQSPVSPRS